MNKKRAEFLRRGFTLTELMIAVAIIALLAGFLAPSVSTYMRRNQGQAAASDVAGVLRWARSQAMSRGQVVLLDITPASGTANGKVEAFRTWDASCSAADPEPDCYAQSCAQAQTFPAAGIIEVESAELDLANTSPDMIIDGVDTGGAAALTYRFCFAPDGRVLSATGQAFSSDCDGVNARIFVQAKDNNGFTNEFGGQPLNICLDETHNEADRLKQKNGRDVANFFVIQVPFNGAISVVQ